MKLKTAEMSLIWKLLITMLCLYVCGIRTVASLNKNNPILKLERQLCKVAKIEESVIFQQWIPPRTTSMTLMISMNSINYMTSQLVELLSQQLGSQQRSAAKSDRRMEFFILSQHQVKIDILIRGNFSIYPMSCFAVLSTQVGLSPY